MKSVGWSPLDYLDKEMYAYWQESLENESRRKEERAHRKERRRKQRERRILKLQRELQEKEAAEFANQQRQRSPSNAHELPQYHADKPVSHSVSIEAIAIDVSPKTKKKTAKRRRTQKVGTIDREQGAKEEVMKSQDFENPAVPGSSTLRQEYSALEA